MLYENKLIISSLFIYLFWLVHYVSNQEIWNLGHKKAKQNKPVNCAKQRGRRLARPIVKTIALHVIGMWTIMRRCSTITWCGERSDFPASDDIFLRLRWETSLRGPARAGEARTNPPRAASSRGQSRGQTFFGVVTVMEEQRYPLSVRMVGVLHKGKSKVSEDGPTVHRLYISLNTPSP